MNKFVDQFQRLKQQRTILFMLIFALVAVLVWMASSIFYSQQQVKLSPDLINLAKVLVPSLDGEVIEELKQKKVYAEEDLAEFEIFTLNLDEQSGAIKVLTLEEQAALVAKNNAAAKASLQPPSPTPRSELVIETPAVTPAEPVN